MLNRRSLPKVLLMLSAFVFFSAGTLHLVENTSADLFVPVEGRYQLDFDSVISKGPYLNLKSAIIVNYDNGKVIYGKRADVVRPIASLTKLVMAMVLLDSDVKLDSTATITREDARRSSRSRLKVGFELTIKDLLYAALMNSDNRASRAIARTVAGSYDAFTKLMTIKVKRMGLKDTRFVEPTGLDKRNVSTAHEMAKIVHYANDYKVIAGITSRKSYRVRILNRKNMYRQMANTNMIVHSRYTVQAGKTGYIQAADYCLATLVKNRKGGEADSGFVGSAGGD